MASLHDQDGNADSSSGTILSTLNQVTITAGDLVYWEGKWEGANGANPSFDTGASTPVASVACAVVDNPVETMHTASGWWVATATGSFTPRMVLDAARNFRTLRVWVISPDVAGSVWTLDAATTVATTSGNSTATPTAGPLSATRKGVAFAGFGAFSSVSLTAGAGWTIPSEFAGASFLPNEYRLVSGAGSITANGTLSGSPHTNTMLAIFGETVASSDVSGSATLEDAGAGGTLQGNLSNLSGGATLDDGSAGGGLSGAASASITTAALKNNTGTVLAGLLVDWVMAIRLSDKATTLYLAQTTNASGQLVLGGLAAGDHLVVTSNAAGTAAGARKYTAA